MEPTIFEIRLNNQIVATCIQELVKPFINTLMTLIGTEFNIDVRIKENEAKLNIESIEK